MNSPTTDPKVENVKPRSSADQQSVEFFAASISHPGPYTGQLALSHAAKGEVAQCLKDRKEYKQLLMAPYSQRSDVHMWVALSFPPHVNEAFPTMLVGGQTLGIKHQGHLEKKDVRLGNLWQTMFGVLGVAVSKDFQGGEADGVIKELV
jgi:hypothetical protein